MKWTSTTHSPTDLPPYSVYQCTWFITDAQIWLVFNANPIYGGLRLGVSTAGSQHKMGSLGNFRRVAAELWGRGVAVVASNVEWSIIVRILHVQHSCSENCTILMTFSFFYFYDIFEWSLVFSQDQVWGRRRKALRNPGLRLSTGPPWWRTDTVHAFSCRHARASAQLNCGLGLVRTHDISRSNHSNMYMRKCDSHVMMTS